MKRVSISRGTATLKRTEFKRVKFDAAKPSLPRRSGKRRSARSTLKAGTRMKAKPDPLLAAWGRRVRARDGNACRFPGMCATGDERIDPHHIAPRSRRPDLIYVDANGLCLCRTHHDWCHDNPIQAERMGLLSTESYELARRAS